MSALKTSARLSVGCLLFSGCFKIPKAVFFNDPLSIEEHVKLASAYSAQGEKELSKREYRAALKRDSENVPALVGMGNLFYDEGEWKKAQKYFKRALKYSPGNAAASNNLAMAYVGRGICDLIFSIRLRASNPKSKKIKRLNPTELP
jgi:tetratricopeptide (TPR) repeat protein